MRSNMWKRTVTQQAVGTAVLSYALLMQMLCIILLHCSSTVVTRA